MTVFDDRRNDQETTTGSDDRETQSAVTPRAERPYMPGYGMLPPDQGTGLLPWSWAEERILAARNLWVATLFPDGRPQLSAVWGTWHAGQVLFTCAPTSAKARNLARDPRITVSTEDANDPVVVEGTAREVADRAGWADCVAALNAKYPGSYEVGEGEPSGIYLVTPVRAFGLRHEDFTGSPTRWTF
jgi:PPOX class probable F420-dependent enzyme